MTDQQIEDLLNFLHACHVQALNCAAKCQDGGPDHQGFEIFASGFFQAMNCIQTLLDARALQDGGAR